MHRGQGPGLAGRREKTGKSTELTVELGFLGRWEITKLGKEGPREGLAGPEAGRLLCSGYDKWFCVVGLQHALGTMQERGLGQVLKGLVCESVDLDPGGGSRKNFHREMPCYRFVVKNLL